MSKTQSKQPDQQRRVIFNADAKLSIKRPAAAKFTADGAAAQAPDRVTLEGYAITWNTLSSDRGGYRVRLLPNSVTFTPIVHALFNHSYQAILGSTENDTLRLTTDNVGVKVEIDLPETSYAEDVAELVGKEYVKGMSFSMLFDPMPESSTSAEGGIEIMSVAKFVCDEVTITAIPSFDTTSIAVQQSDDDGEAQESQEAQDDGAFARNEHSRKLTQARLAMLAI